MTAKDHLKALKGLKTDKAYQYIIDNMQGFKLEVPEVELESDRLNTTIDYSTLVDLQGNFKDLETEKFVKLVRSFLEKGFFAPLFVWRNKDVNYTFDGHQRHRVLKSINAYPKQLPCVFIQASSEKDAKEKLLLLNGQYSKVTKDGFDEFIASAGIEFDFLNDTTTFDEFFDVEFKVEKETLKTYKIQLESEKDIEKVVTFMDKEGIDYLIK